VSPLPRLIRQQLRTDTRGVCGYCQTQERVSGIPLTTEHILPLAKGGSDTIENLWQSCRSCNEAKGVMIEFPDPESGTTTPLFNPRTQPWNLHFRWNADYSTILGTTPAGKATVAALNLNDEIRVSARQLWHEAGYHPPD